MLKISCIFALEFGTENVLLLTSPGVKASKDTRLSCSFVPALFLAPNHFKMVWG